MDSPSSESSSTFSVRDDVVIFLRFKILLEDLIVIITYIEHKNQLYRLLLLEFGYLLCWWEEKYTKLSSNNISHSIYV